MAGAPPPRLYAIADLGVLGAERLPAAVATMARCGVRWIQLRAKAMSGAELIGLTAACQRAVAGTGALLWLDDRVDVAALRGVGGVHVGQRDLPPGAARALLGEAVRIGQSTHEADQVARADADPAVDVIAVGPVFPTRGKRDPEPVVGRGFVGRARSSTAKPLVAIGGITADNAASVLAAGADTVAVLGAVCRGDIEHSCARLLAAVGGEP